MVLGRPLQTVLQWQIVWAVSNLLLFLLTFACVHPAVTAPVGVRYHRADAAVNEPYALNLSGDRGTHAASMSQPVTDENAHETDVGIEPAVAAQQGTPYRLAFSAAPAPKEHRGLKPLCASIVVRLSIQLILEAVVLAFLWRVASGAPEVESTQRHDSRKEDAHRFSTRRAITKSQNKVYRGAFFLSNCR